MNRYMSLVALLLCRMCSARRRRDFERHRGEASQGGKGRDEGTRGDCILKVTKKTATTTDYSTIKFYYVIYHCTGGKQMTVEFTARNKKEEFALPEAQNTEGASSDQWNWEQAKGFLPKYFAKDKPGAA